MPETNGDPRDSARVGSWTWRCEDNAPLRSLPSLSPCPPQSLSKMRHSKGSSAFLAQTCFPHKPRNQRTLAWPGPFHGRHRLLCSFGDREQGKATLFRVGMKALSWALPVMLCVLGKVTQPLSASFSSSAKHHNHRRSGIQHVQILWNMAQHKTRALSILASCLLPLFCVPCSGLPGHVVHQQQRWVWPVPQWLT